MKYLQEFVIKRKWKHERKQNKELLKQEILDLIKNFHTTTERESHAKWFGQRGFKITQREFFGHKTWKIEP